jgi:ribosomal protein L28
MLILKSQTGYKCAICGKGKQRANKVSHAKNRTRIFRKPNLHLYNLLIKGKKVRVKMCVKCRRLTREKRSEV